MVSLARESPCLYGQSTAQALPTNHLNLSFAVSASPPAGTPPDSDVESTGRHRLRLWRKGTSIGMTHVAQIRTIERPAEEYPVHGAKG